MPSSVTAVSASHWWVLGFVSCGSGRCPRIETTENAGASFQSVPAPGGRLGETAATPEIAFANAEDGWFFGPKLFATRDGGRRWTAISIPGTVTEVEAGSDDVFAVVRPATPSCAETGRCTPETTPKAPLWDAVIGSDDWRPDLASRSDGASVGLGVHGRSVWVTDTDGLAIGSGLLHSSDDGAHFALEPQRATGIASFYLPVSSQVVWEYDSGGHFMFAGRSTDAGAHFRAVGPQSPTKTTPDGYPNGSSLEPASSTTAVAASDLVGRSALIRTSDAGTMWKVVQPRLNHDGYWTVIGFTTAEVGYALWTEPGASATQNSAQLWRTTNGGATWSGVTQLS